MIFGSDFPIQHLEEYRIKELIRHENDTFDLVYIFYGELKIRSDFGATTNYSADNIFVLQKNHSYEIIPIQDSHVIHIGIDTNFMQRYNILPGQVVCDSVLEPNRNYQPLISSILLLSGLALDQPNYNRLSMLSQVFALLNILQTNHTIVRPVTEEINIKHQKRIEEIQEYMASHYKQQISLTDLADSLYLTPQYLSRFFKEHMGTSFHQYLTSLRLEYATNELLYTGRSVTDIATQSGFQSITTFNRSFKSQYGMSPKDYRLDNKVMPTLTPSGDVSVVQRNNLNTVEHSQTITVGTAAVRNIPHNFTKLINIGYAHTLLSHSSKETLLSAAQSMKLEYIRMEALISNSMIPRLSTSEQEEYYFAKVDEILSFLYENNLTPFVVIGKNPFDYISALRLESKSFLNKERFVRMFEAFLNHIMEYYPISWLNTWYFEFWRDPAATLQNYFDGYILLSNMVKERIPNARFGGPGHNQTLPSQVYLDTIEGFKANNILPDFISLHAFYLQYSLDNLESIDYTKISRSFLGLQKWTIEKNESVLGTNIPVIFTEFNSSIVTGTHINSSCFQATFIVKTLLELHEQSDMIGYWLLDDDFVRADLLSVDLTPEIALIDKNNIPFPSFFAYLLLGYLGTQLIEKGDNYCITKSDDTHYQILVYNYAHLANVEKLSNTDSYYPLNDVYSFFEQVPGNNITVTLKGLPSGVYSVRRHLIDRYHGSFMDIKLGGFRGSNISEVEYLYKMATPDPITVKHMRSHCQPEVRIVFKEVTDELSLSIHLEPHNVCLFDIRLEM